MKVLKDDKLDHIDGGKLFPDFYSWWSVYHLLHSTDIKFSVPDYLKNESIYGGNGFKCDFQTVLTEYAKSRSPERSIGDVCIRMGGILLYKCEICHVLIICLTDDNDTLKNHKIFNDETIFQSDGFITKEGGIDLKGSLTFKPKYSTVRDENYEYESSAFAFYFPDSIHQRLTVAKKFCSKQTFRHKPHLCLKKQKGKCPDKIKPCV